MTTPRISVLMPAHNAASTIAEAIDSVLAQTLGDWELIVVDDGSADATAQLISNYSDERIRLVRQPQQGASVARNRAFAESHGELICFLDADDRFAPTKLAAQAALLDARPEIGSTYCAHRRVDLDGVGWTLQAPPWEVGFRDFLLGFPFNPSAQMVRRHWHDESGGFRPGLAIHEDRDYWLRLCAAGCRFARTPGVLIDYRLGPPKPAKDPAETVRQALDVLDRALKLSGAKSIAMAEWKAARSDIFREWAFQTAISGKTGEAAALFEKMLALEPDVLRSAQLRDGLLQAMVDVSVRSRGDHEPLLAAVFDALPARLHPLRPEQRWAMGCGAVLQGERELLWHRDEATRERFEYARTVGARLDERTSNLLRYDLQQLAGALGQDELQAMKNRLLLALTALTSRQSAEAFVSSLQQPAGPAGRLSRAKGLLGRLLGVAQA